MDLKYEKYQFNPPMELWDILFLVCLWRKYKIGHNFYIVIACLLN